MNLPNKLTLLRILLVPVFVFCMDTSFPGHFLAALLVFAAASVTDALDGKIARSRGLITTFGKFADPLADKILVLAAFAVMQNLNTQLVDLYGRALSLHVTDVVVILIAAREFMVSGLRLVTAEKGVVVAAGIWGKLKTAFTMVTQVAILVYLTVLEFADYALPGTVMRTMSWVFLLLVWASVVLTWISGGIYLKGYWKYIDMK
ncbi:MAG: CDP-diacylglycerol--glycerol-3-phosphate 3-phosphatidyltransferase [Oscillospiraceae bacterium]|nr:CDP-diacylglycerol--glycerol-3-phosphate 3-phosphatidyltransferase [Oscillospiraceae bacterium]